MKKYIALVLVGLMALFAAAIAEQEDWCCTTACELTECLSELVNDDTYQEMYMSRAFECVDTLKDADYSEVDALYFCKLPDDMGMRVLLGLMSQGKLSDVGKANAVRAFKSSAFTIYNGTIGTEAIAAASMLTYSCTYVMPSEFEDCAYIVETDGVLTGVTFVKTGENTITGTAVPLFQDDGATIEDTLNALKSGTVPMEITQIQ